ncbi:Transmembrane emp24 domain-containing protein 7 [Lamellibrachia satsuma]|nr:Transmembrane emp24 domain-containing protein 7 [Lamellibrachia satsuma]
MCYGIVLAGEMTFELPDSVKQCFYEHIEKNVKCTLEYQVITGGNYDVDVEIIDVEGHELHKDSRKQYDSYMWVTGSTGEYKFCFSNEFSTFTHKTIYFDFQVGDEKPLHGDSKLDMPMTQMETSSQIIHNELKIIIDYQTHHRLREAQGRVFAENLNERVQYWSVGQAVIILLVGIGQVMVLRSFFTDKRQIVVSST